MTYVHFLHRSCLVQLAVFDHIAYMTSNRRSITPKKLPDLGLSHP
jgi:hypothetical protein